MKFYPLIFALISLGVVATAITVKSARTYYRTKAIKESKDNPRYQKYLRLIKPNVDIEFMGVKAKTTGDRDVWCLELSLLCIPITYVDFDGVTHRKNLYERDIDLIVELM